MSINGSLYIGRTGITAAQLGINVAGNNIANASTPGFTRQRLDLGALGETPYGNLRIGRGVEALGIRRIVDQALQNRLMRASGEDAFNQANFEQLSALEDLLDPFVEDIEDLSSERGVSVRLSQFFDSWSALRNASEPATARATVVEQGARLASDLRRIRTALSDQQTQIDAQIGQSVNQANDLLRRIGELNRQISASGAQAGGGLADQRDVLLNQLSEIVDLTVVPQETGAVNVQVGSVTMVAGSNVSQFVTEIQDINGKATMVLRAGEPAENVNVATGRLAALLGQRATGTGDLTDRLDTLTGQIIFQVNKLHSTGLSTVRQTSFTGERAFSALDRTRALNDPANETIGQLPFRATSGRLVVAVTPTNAGPNDLPTRTTIDIDLDGLTNAGTAGFGDDTTLESLRGQIDAIAGITATINAEGKLVVAAENGFSVGFTEDTSGVLAVLGVNGYFTGTNASDIAVRSDLRSNSDLLSTRSVVGSTIVDNGIATAISELRNMRVPGLSDSTMTTFWDSAMQKLAVGVGGAKTNVEAAQAVRANIEAQLQAQSGVSLDEEAINLIQYQTMYNASARYISTIQELTQTLLQLV